MFLDLGLGFPDELLIPLMNKTCLDLGSLVPKTLAVVVLELDLKRERGRG